MKSLALIITLLSFSAASEELTYEQKMELAGMCTGYADIASNIQYMRNTDEIADTYPSFVEGISKAGQYEHVQPGLTKQIIEIAEVIYNGVDKGESPAQVFIAFYNHCISESREHMDSGEGEKIDL